MGAWIEIPHYVQGIFVPQQSLLSWERGLKLTGLEDSENERPSLLSWERGLKSTLIVTKKRDRVAPLVGAWIEIQQKNAKRMQAQSLLSWERGLKYQDSEELHSAKTSLLSWERGLK